MLDVRKQSRDEAILRPENDYGREIPLSYDSPLQADNKIFDRFHAVADSVLDVERKPGDWDTYSMLEVYSRALLSLTTDRILFQSCWPSKLLVARSLYCSVLLLHYDSSVLVEALDGIPQRVDKLLCMHLCFASYSGLDSNERHYVVRWTNWAVVSPICLRVQRTTHMRVATTSGASFHSSLLTTTLGYVL